MTRPVSLGAKTVFKWTGQKTSGNMKVNNRSEERLVFQIYIWAPCFTTKICNAVGSLFTKGILLREITCAHKHLRLKGRTLLKMTSRCGSGRSNLRRDLQKSKGVSPTEFNWSIWASASNSNWTEAESGPSGKRAVDWCCHDGKRSVNESIK